MRSSKNSNISNYVIQKSTMLNLTKNRFDFKVMSNKNLWRKPSHYGGVSRVV